MPLFGLSDSDVYSMEAKRDVKGLIKALTYKKSQIVRRAAANALGRIGDAQAVDALVGALEDEESTVRGCAVTALANIRDARAIDALVVALKNQNAYVRFYAAKALGRAGGTQAADVLIASLKDEIPSVRKEAASALAEFGDSRAVDGLLVALKDQDATVRLQAVEALGKIGDARAIDGLLDVALKDKELNVRQKAKEVLAKIGGEHKLNELKLRQTHYNLNNITEEASNLILEALKIIETLVTLERGFSVVVGAGDVGPSMDAAGKLEAAHKLHPGNPLIHYAYASGLFLAMQFKSAREVMEDCAKSHPEFLLAQYAIKSWNYAEWKSLFLLPQWGPDTRIIPPVIAQTVKTQIVLPVREGIRPRAALFFRDVDGNFSDAKALQDVPIELATVISPVNNPQIVCICAKICDNPSNPLIVESLQVPLHPHGHSARSTFEYFCLQEDMDLVMMDRQDRILLNKRLPFSSRMMKANMNIQAMLNSSEGRTVSPMELIIATQSHQRQVSLSDIQF